MRAENKMGDNNSRPPVTGYPAATGYPYQPPPQPQIGYPNPYPYPDQRTIFFRRIFAIFLAAIGLVFAILFLIWFLIRPRLPIFHVSNFNISNFNVSTSPSLITGNWDVLLIAQNPNTKTNLYYERIDASVFYKDALLSQTSLPPFDQGTNNQTSVRATFAAAGAYVETWVVDGISKDRSRQRVGFNVKLVAVVRFKAHGFWRQRRRWVRVYCRGLELGLTAAAGNASLVDQGQRECRVGV